MDTQLKPLLDTELLETSRPLQPGTSRRDLLLLVLLSVLLSAARWCTLYSLWGDSPRWIFEAYRASRELLYRDFAWQYPPLSLLMSGAALRLVPTFWSLQLLLDIVSAAVVLLAWDLARRFLPKPLPLLTAAAMACAGASNTSNFALFSLQVYTPAVPVGLIGLLLVLREVVDYLKTGVIKSRSIMWLSLGSAICLLSKPEYMLGLVGGLGALALIDLCLWYRERLFSEWLGHYAKLALSCCVPAAFVYGVLAALCGPGNLLAGMGGYGQAAFSCPWWPTGLGVLGALAALGYGVIGVAVLSLTRLRDFHQRYGRKYWILWAGAAVSLLPIALYLPYCADLPMFHGRITATHALKYFVSTGTLLLPVMWFSLLLAIVLAMKLFRSLNGTVRFSVRDAILFTVVSSAALISVRGLFNGIMTELTVATPAAYPIWFIMGPYFLIRILEQARLSSPKSEFVPSLAPFSVTAIVGAFLVFRVFAVLMGEVRPPYAKITTAGGTVRLKDLSVSPRVYAFVESHSSPHEPLLDLAGGGGINTADHRPSPIFSTQFTNLAPSQHLQELDEQLIRAHPPRIVIANASANFGASYGICLNTGCTFPALVWRSSRQPCDASAIFPALDYIRQNYTPAATFGDRVIYFRRAR